jgi:hypothetical protein
VALIWAWLLIDLVGLSGLAWLQWTDPHPRIRWGLLRGVAGVPLVLALVMLLTWLSE